MISYFKDEPLRGTPGYRFSSKANDPITGQPMTIDFFDGELNMCRAKIRGTTFEAIQMQPAAAAQEVWLRYQMYHGIEDSRGVGRPADSA